MRTLTPIDLADILTGAAFLGSGGGGPLWLGSRMIQQLEGATIQLADPATDVPNDAAIAVTSFAGIPDVLKPQQIDYGAVTNDALVELERTSGSTFSFLLPLETGAGNTFVPMTAAALRKIPVIDADGARRAIPSPLTTTYASVPLSDIALASSATEALSLDSQNPAVLFQALVPVLLGTDAFKLGAAMALWNMTGAQMKPAIVPGSITYALNLGVAIRHAIESHHDPVQAAVEYVGGTLFFVGQIKSATVGLTSPGKVVLISGTEEVIIYNQPDNLLAWNAQQAQPLVMAPDLICFMTPQGQPLSTSDLDTLPPNQEIAVIGAPAVSQLVQPPLLNGFMMVLSSLGYGGPFVSLASSLSNQS